MRAAAQTFGSELPHYHVSVTDGKKNGTFLLANTLRELGYNVF